MISETKLAEMLCTRLCHDLTGPIGAVNNGAEFLGEEGFDMQNEAVQLILSSAHEAVHRLMFYRLAYGRVNDSGEACLADKKQIATDFFSGTKVKLDWPDSHTDASGISISQKMARLILNLLIISAASLIRGGTISVRLSATEEEKQISVTAQGDVIKQDTDTLAILRGEGDDAMLSPKSAQPFLAMKLLEEVGGTLALEAHADRLEITVRQRQVIYATAAN
jgi:histidine phosphotransferase ChpT